MNHLLIDLASGACINREMKNSKVLYKKRVLTLLVATAVRMIARLADVAFAVVENPD
jgi:hypothetical protein